MKILFKLQNKYFLMVVNIVFNFYPLLYEPRQKKPSLFKGDGFVNNYNQLKTLKLCTLWGTWIRDHIADISHTRSEEHQALKAQTKTTMYSCTELT